jgi:uncharacterized protein with PIN domain/sulfur carrier protein ThiS
MPSAYFRFYADLNYFLSADRQGEGFDCRFEYRATVKDMIESLGVPHPEIELILVNGEPVDFTHIVQDGDRISVYPFFETFDTSNMLRVRPPTLTKNRFVLDIHLGRLAAYLRMFGFDTLWRNDYPDEELAHVASTEQRILLTRDRGLLKRSIVRYGYCVREKYPRRQVIEVARRFKLGRTAQPFLRCLRCNGLLKSVDKEEIRDQLDPLTCQYHDVFTQCRECNQIYWRGTHYERMLPFVQEVLAAI